MSDINVQTFSGKVNVTNNLLVGTSHLFVDTVNNKVGITTASPDAGLHVNSNAYVNTDFRVGTSIVMNDTDGQITAGSFVGNGSGLSNVNSDSGLWTGAGTGNVYLSTSTHNVGIGTSEPNKKLHIYTDTGEGNTQLHLESADRYSTIQMLDDNGAILFGNDRGAMRFITGYDTYLAGGSEAMRILGNGNVGIGTNDPGEKLQVNGNLRLGSSSNDTVDDDNNRYISTAGQLTIIANDSGLNGNYVNIALQAGKTNPGQIIIGGGTLDQYKDIEFYTCGSSTERMRIHHDGNVGIGTNDPQGKLHLHNNNTLVDKRTVVTTADYRQSLNYTNYSSVAQGIHRDPDNARGMWLGNFVDENDASPSGANFIAFTDSLTFYANSDRTTHGDALSFVSNTDRLQYGSGEFGKLLHINSNGNVGIGHTSPIAKLDIKDGNRTGTTPTHNMAFYVTTDVGSEGPGPEIRHSNQSQGIGFGYQSIYATGSNANQEIKIISRGSSNVYIKNYAVYSDDRIKTNEQYITNAMKTLLKLKPQIYDKHEKINEICDNPTREAGLIAQDVYYDAPELRYLISARNDGIDDGPVNIPEEKPFVDDDPTKDPDYSGWGNASAGIAYIQFVPYLIKAVQEIHEDLQTTRSQLEGDLQMTHSQLEEEFQTLRTQFGEDLQTTQTQIDETRTQIDETQTQLDQTQAQIDETQAQLEETRTELSAEKAKTYQLQKRLELLEMSHAALINRIENL